MGRASKPNPAFHEQGRRHEHARLWTALENKMLDCAVAKYGHRWQLVIKHMEPDRTAASTRNHWMRMVRCANACAQSERVSSCRHCGLRRNGHTCLVQLRNEVAQLDASDPRARFMQLDGSSGSATASVTTGPELDLGTKTEVESGARRPDNVESNASPECSPSARGPGALGPFVCEPLTNLLNLGALPRPGSPDDWCWSEWPSLEPRPYAL